jgi:GT2 family glycosyltransferase
MRRFLNDHSVNLSVSIVIPTYNGLKLLEQNLPAVVRATQGAEIIVVDDASSDATAVWLSKNYPEIRVVKHDLNRRFASACNTGVMKAGGEIIVLLNNDVKPAADFLSPLLKPFTDPSVFAVGCKEIEETQGQRLEQGRCCGGFKRGLMVHWRCTDQEGLDSLWVFGGSGAFRKTGWEKLGGMDPLFAPAYEEDRDICYRALKRGWTIKFAPKSLVYHEHESTNIDVLGIRGMQIASFKNQFLIVWKNITHLPYVLSHMFWLPYHLVFTGIRSHGALVIGFMQAIGVLPQILKKRALEKSAQTVSDVKILKTHAI